jgi:tetratricopeptide (TPR) repeat protein
MVVTQSQLRPGRRASITRMALVFSAILALSLGAGHGQTAAQSDQASLSKELYEAATAAQTVEELNRVAVRLEQARSDGLSAPEEKYLANLQAWLLHRRGEAFMKQAAEATAAGDPAAGQRWDALALADFDAALQLDPQRWKSYHQRAVCRAVKGELEAAIGDFTRSIELRAEHTSSWFNRGEIHYETGQFARAIADYDEALRLQPDEPGFHASRGHAYFQLRQFARALEDYQKAVELDPDNAEYHASRGEAYRSLGQWEQAANDFRHAINLDPQHGRAYQSVAWLMATCPDESYRNADLALRAIRKSVELNGDQDYITLDTLAAAFANNGEFDKAQSALRRALQLAPPDNAEPLRQRLKLYRAGRPYRQTHVATASAQRGEKRY